ncbi:MAG: hypothetical protein QG597_4217, partial [Actinomycetota bacterium]|nr:hypothetical protein [Actinomycetota bacterium]
LDGKLTFRTELFDREGMDRLTREFQDVINALAQHPNCPVGERAEPPAGLPQDHWQRGPDVCVPDLCLHQLFSRHAEGNPDVPALIFGERTLSYAALDRRANQLAHRLIGLGVGAESVVAVCLDRSTELVVTLLAILKSGGAYLPLDPGWPSDRKSLALRAIGPRRWILTDDARAGEWAFGATLVDPTDEGLSRHPSEPPDGSLHTAGQLAYVNFTSGSTGEPKGVLIEHRGVLRLLDPDAPWAMAPSDRMLHLAPMAFDAATLEIWLPLLSGGTLVLAPPGRLGLDQIADIVVQQSISVLWLTSGLFHAMVETEPHALAGVRRLLAGGDVLDPASVQAVLNLMPPEHLLINGYGPTESTTFATYHAMAGGSVLPEREPVPIGRPLAGTTLRVLDAAGSRCAVGESGELYIGGDGLARGYLNAAELTAERFVSDPAGSGERLYRTGDVVSWRPDGSLAFGGRIDEQIKLRGHRVDLAEVRAALSENPAVACAVVVPVFPHGAPDSPVIVAYWTCRPGQAVTPVQLRAFLAEMLPDAMIPTAFVQVDRFPLTPNGKVDRGALPPPPFVEGDGVMAPDTPTERRLHAIWSDILGHGAFGVTDNFFMVGGHSLQAVRLHARINEEFASTFPLSLVVGSPTIRSQAQWLSGRITGTSTDDMRLVPIQPRGDQAPLIAVPGWGGTLYHFVDMARALAPHRPVLGLQPAGFEYPSAIGSVEEMAGAYAESIIERIPDGPIHLVGHSAGGWYAHAVAAALIQRGRTIGLLAIFDSHAQGAHVHWWLRLRLRLLPFQWHVLRRKLDRIYRPPGGVSRRAWIRRRIAVRINR